MRKLTPPILAFLVLVCLGIWLWLVWLEQSRDAPYHHIEDGLYLGGSVAQPPSGTEAVVNLCGREDSYTVPAALWEPIFEADKEPSIDWLRRVVGFIDDQRQAGRTVYVHCLAGMNRSGAAVTAYLMFEHGWDRDVALAFIQGRPQVQPNPTLMRLLAQWQWEMGGKNSRQ